MKSRVSIICQVFGHSWVYKDLTDYVNEKGMPYQEKAKRKCMRCKKREATVDKTEWFNYFQTLKAT